MNVQQIWRHNVTRLYTYKNEAIPVMLLGFKRDLRVEDEHIIYPQEVRSYTGNARLEEILIGLGISYSSGDEV